MKKVRYEAAYDGSHSCPRSKFKKYGSPIIIRGLEKKNKINLTEQHEHGYIFYLYLIKFIVIMIIVLFIGIIISIN